jgi:hypothetical protein
VHREITSIFGRNKVILRDTKRPVTPYGGLAVFVEYLGKIGYREEIRKHMPIFLTSPNAIDPTETFTAFVVSVLTGARRSAHAGLLRLDKALHSMLGMVRFPTDDTIRNLFKRFSQARVYQFYSKLTEWQIERLPERSAGYSLDLDSTVFERYGQQEGALKGYNPKKHGRASHHPLLAILGEAHFVLHGWLRSGNCSSSRGVVEFLKEALALLRKRLCIRVVRADSGFFDEKLLSFLEEQKLFYIVVARLTRWIKGEVVSVKAWRDLDSVYSVGEFNKQLHGWSRERRIVVVRERLREKPSVGRRLLTVPGYTFRLFVTTLSDAPEIIWRDYNQRADMEKRIAELKYDLAADDFCLHEFFATEAAFCAILLLFNLLSEFQRVSGMQGYRQPATLRAHVFLCGAILRRAGHRQVLHMSSAWGGLEKRNPLIDRILTYIFPTSPKLESHPEEACP